MTPDEGILDDPAGLALADSGEMLVATASAGAQVRRGLVDTDPDELARAAAEGRPRSIVVTGMGGSGISGDVLAAVLGAGAPIPVSTVRGYRLPGWVGPVDLVVAVSCSGSTEETLTVAGQAVARGARVVGVGAEDSALHELIGVARSPFLSVDAQGRMPRASLWTLATPLLLLAQALELVDLSDGALERTADLLDEVAAECAPLVPPGENRAKDLGYDLAVSLPVVWGTGEVGPVAAYRLACQLNENAKQDAIHGALPEANHNQVVAFAGPGARHDLFADPALDSGPRLILVRDSEEHEQVAARADISRELAEDAGVPVTVLRASGRNSLERLASLVSVIDFASVYAAFVRGVDPSPIGPIVELKARLAR